MFYPVTASDALIEETRHCRRLAVEQAKQKTEALLLAGYAPVTERLSRRLLALLRTLPRRGAGPVTDTHTRIASGEV